MFVPSTPFPFDPEIPPNLRSNVSPSRTAIEWNDRPLKFPAWVSLLFLDLYCPPRGHLDVPSAANLIELPSPKIPFEKSVGGCGHGLDAMNIGIGSAWELLT